MNDNNNNNSNNNNIDDDGNNNNKNSSSWQALNDTFLYPLLDLTWTLRDFIAWAKIGQPIAGNFYQAKWDPWVDELWETFVDEDGYGC